MQKITTILRQKLKNAERVVILGVGSDLRSDDIAGLLTAKQIKKNIRGTKKLPKVKVLLGATAPENLTGEIKKYRPTHLIIIDSADLGSSPGKIAVMSPSNIGGTSFCTHSLPLKVMADYLLESLRCEIIVIGIQPKNLTVGASPSKKILDAAESLAAAITSLLQQR